jgi:hypothetical protein
MSTNLEKLCMDEVGKCEIHVWYYTYVFSIYNKMFQIKILLFITRMFKRNYVELDQCCFTKWKLHKITRCSFLLLVTLFEILMENVVIVDISTLCLFRYRVKRGKFIGTFYKKININTNYTTWHHYQGYRIDLLYRQF